MAGIPVSANDVNYKVGQLAIDIRTRLADARTLKRWFDDHDNAALAGIGIGDTDATLLRAVVNAYESLARIHDAQATQPAPNDFGFDARKIVGLN